MELVVLEGEYEGKYRTRIEEVGERIISVGAPFIKSEIIPLHEGTKVEITFWDEVAAYSIETKILKRISFPIALFVLGLPEAISKVQRRNFVRVPAFYSLTFRTVTREGLRDLFQGTMLDLSGGGLRFLTKEFVENNCLLYTQLTLPNDELQTPVRVCRVEKVEGKQRYIVSVEFHDISERERDKIVRCVFDIQRSMRKKGLI